MFHSLLWSTQSRALSIFISRSRFFSGILLLFQWSSRCWQFDLWFLCLILIQKTIWKFMVHILQKPGLKNFKHYFASAWDEYNYAVVWTFFGITLLWDWNENCLFPVLWPLLSFPNLLACWVQHFHSIRIVLPRFILAVSQGPFLLMYLWGCLWSHLETIIGFFCSGTSHRQIGN